MKPWTRVRREALQERYKRLRKDPLGYRRQSRDVAGEVQYLDEHGWYAEVGDERVYRTLTWALKSVLLLASLRYSWWRREKVYWFRKQWCSCVVYNSVHYLHPCNRETEDD